MSKSGTPETTGSELENTTAAANLTHASQLGRQDTASVNMDDEHEDSDHNSLDERATFGSSAGDELRFPDPTSFSQIDAQPHDAGAAHSALKVDANDLSLLSSTKLSLSATSIALSSGTIVSLSPEASGILDHRPPTSSKTKEIITSVPPLRPLQNSTQYGGKRKARTSDSSTTTSPPRPKKKLIKSKPRIPSASPSPEWSPSGDEKSDSEDSTASDMGPHWYDEHFIRADSLAASNEWGTLLSNWIAIEKDLGNSIKSVGLFNVCNIPY